jgi:hypothetical protein
MIADAAIARALTWMLDLDDLAPAVDEPLSLHWSLPFPLWFILPVAAVLVCVVVFSIRRERVSPIARVVLAAFRVSAIACVVVMVAGPSLQLQRNRREKSWVAVMVDRSQSMLVSDESIDDGDVRRTATRIEAARRAFSQLERSQLESILRRHRVELFTFGTTVARGSGITSTGNLSNTLDDALASIRCEDESTDLIGAVTHVLGTKARGRLAGIVVVSDGRATESRRIQGVIDSAKRSDVPINSLTIGSAFARCDWAITGVMAAERAFLKDSIEVVVQIRSTNQPADETVVVTIVDAVGRVVAERSVTLLAPVSPATSTTHDVVLTIHPNTIGHVEYVADIRGECEEVVGDNNERRFAVDVLREQIRVLYVEGYPRYEYRYLKNALLREPTIRSSCLLLSADSAFAQEGTDPIRRFPVDLEELSLYDVVVLGDVDLSGHWISAAQKEMIIHFVAEMGGGFGWIAGPRYAQHSLDDALLKTLVPVHNAHGAKSFMNDGATRASPLLVTDAGRSSGLFASQESDQTATGYGDLRWSLTVSSAKPGAEILANHPYFTTPAGDPLPVFVSGRFGAGNVLFCGSDDTWRWRRRGAEWLFDTFWLRVCRLLVRSEGTGTDRHIRLTTHRDEYSLGQRVRIRAEILQTDLAESLADTLDTVLIGDSESPLAHIALERVGNRAAVFEGWYVPVAAGHFRLEVEEPVDVAGKRRASTSFSVSRSIKELQTVEADHELLEAIASGTGGITRTTDGLADVFLSIPDRSIQVPDDVTETIWDSKISLILLAFLLTGEWTFRKALGLI